MDKHALLEQIIEIAKEAGEILLGASKIRESSSMKAGHANLVTEYDKRVQRFLIEKLRAVLPEAHFVGEEDGSDVFLEDYARGYAFVIDPIDGTLNFVAGLKPSTVSIALLKDGEPLIGVIGNPYDGVICHALKGEGAFWNGERILSSGEPLSKSLVSFGTAPYYEELSRRGIELALEYLHRGEDLRRSGSAAWDLCLIASGATGLYFELRLGLWDYAAGALIASEAGCKLTDIDGAPLTFRGPSSLLCASRGVAREDYLPGA